MTWGQNDSGQKWLVLLGQINPPSGDKAETPRWKCLMAEDLLTFRHQVVFVTWDFGPKPGPQMFQYENNSVPDL